MLENIDFYNGKVSFNDLDKDTISFLKEMQISEKDLLFVKYPQGLSLDVDWHKGVFFVSVIQKNNWDSPLIKKACNALNELENAIKECIALIKKMIDVESIKNLGKKNILDDVDFYPGEINYSNLYMDPSIPFDENIKNWPQKSLLIEYLHGISIEGESIDGVCDIMVTNGRHIVLKKESKTLEKLKKDMQLCIIKARELVETENKEQ